MCYIIARMTIMLMNAYLRVHNTAPFRLIRAASPYMRDASKEEMDKGKTPEPRCIINVCTIYDCSLSSFFSEPHTSGLNLILLTRKLIIY